MKINSLTAYQPQMAANNNKQKVNQNKTSIANKHNVPNFNASFQYKLDNIPDPASVNKIISYLTEGLTNGLTYLRFEISKLHKGGFMCYVGTSDDIPDASDDKFEEKCITEYQFPVIDGNKAVIAVDNGQLNPFNGLIPTEQDEIAKELSKQISSWNLNMPYDLFDPVDNSNLPIANMISDFFYYATEDEAYSKLGFDLKLGTNKDNLKVSISKMLLMTPEEVKTFNKECKQDDDPVTVLFNFTLAENIDEDSKVKAANEIVNSKNYEEILHDPKQLREMLYEGSRQEK